MKYYCRTLSGDAGPLSFGELVRQVQDGTLTPRDLVREENQGRWRAAESIPGLFHPPRQAGDVHPEAGAPGRTDEGLSGQDLQDLLSQAEPASQTPPPPPDSGDRGSDEPAWRRRLTEVAIQRGKARAAGGTAKGLRGPRQTGSAEREMQTAIGAAAGEASAKEKSRRPRRRWPISIHAVFRIALVLIAANAAGFAIVNWSEVQGKRFPEISSQSRHFPLRGKCSPTEFLVLLTGAMNLAGLAGYGVARCLEALTDD